MQTEQTKPENTIEAGDLVMVNFKAAQASLGKCTVLYTPAATGDSWRFKDTTGKIHYVSEGCTMTLIEKAIQGAKK